MISFLSVMVSVVAGAAFSHSVLMMLYYRDVLSRRAIVVYFVSTAVSALWIVHIIIQTMKLSVAP